VAFSVGLILFFIHSSIIPAASALTSICPTYADGIEIGEVETVQLNEISGLAASREHEDVLWVHNDSGDSARFFALNKQGELLGTYNLQGASATDWEDMTIGPGPVSGEDYLYLADIGDNGQSRASIRVYRTLEPEVSADQEPVNINIADWDELPMQYPASTKYDAETLLIDPISGDLFVVTKDRGGEGVAHVFRNPAPHVDSVMVTLELVDDIAFSQLLTGGDISPSGDAIILRSYTSGLYWERAEGTDLWDAFSESPCSVPIESEPQGEALAFAAYGYGYMTVSEKLYQPIYFYAQQYEISVTTEISAGGTVTSNPSGINCGSDCEEVFDYGTIVTLTAGTNTGYTFSGWQGDCEDSEANCVLTLDEEKTVNAHFDINEYNIIMTTEISAGGTVTSNPSGINCGSDCEEVFDYGTIVTLTAGTNTGYTFSGWQGDCEDSETNCVLTIDEEKTVSVLFYYAKFLPFIVR